MYLRGQRRDFVRGALHRVALLRDLAFLPPQGLVRLFFCFRLGLC